MIMITYDHKGNHLNMVYSLLINKIRFIEVNKISSSVFSLWMMDRTPHLIPSFYSTFQNRKVKAHSLYDVMSLFSGTLYFCVASSLRLGFGGEKVLYGVYFEIWPRHFQFQTHQSSFDRLSRCLLFLVSNRAQYFWYPSVDLEASRRELSNELSHVLIRVHLISYFNVWWLCGFWLSDY